VAILVVESMARLAPRRWVFDARDPDDARRVRMQVIEQLKKGAYAQDRLHTAELIVAELTANVFRYASGPSQVVLEWERGCAPVVHVIDCGPGFSLETKLPDLFSESGRGLYLVSSLAADLSVSHRENGGSHARVVLRQ
jgi:anti-sigma regulatory factor (Ser/Thr protein kinase)